MPFLTPRLAAVIESPDILSRSAHGIGTLGTHADIDLGQQWTLTHAPMVASDPKSVNGISMNQYTLWSLRGRLAALWGVHCQPPDHQILEQ